MSAPKNVLAGPAGVSPGVDLSAPRPKSMASGRVARRWGRVGDSRRGEGSEVGQGQHDLDGGDCGTLAGSSGSGLDGGGVWNSVAAALGASLSDDEAAVCWREAEELDEASADGCGSRKRRRTVFDGVPAFDPACHGSPVTWNGKSYGATWNAAARQRWSVTAPLCKCHRWHRMWRFLADREIAAALCSPECKGQGWYRLKLKYVDAESLMQEGWVTAWHGTKIEALYSIFREGQLRESGDETRGHRFANNSRGVYLFPDRYGTKADWYALFSNLFDDGLFWAAKLEVLRHPFGKVQRQPPVPQMTLKAECVSIVALWLCCRDSATMEIGSWFHVWDPILEMPPDAPRPQLDGSPAKNGEEEIDEDQADVDPVGEVFAAEQIGQGESFVADSQSEASEAGGRLEVEGEGTEADEAEGVMHERHAEGRVVAGNDLATIFEEDEMSVDFPSRGEAFDIEQQRFGPVTRAALTALLEQCYGRSVLEDQVVGFELLVESKVLEKVPTIGQVKDGYKRMPGKDIDTVSLTLLHVLGRISWAAVASVTEDIPEVQESRFLRVHPKRYWENQVVDQLIWKRPLLCLWADCGGDVGKWMPEARFQDWMDAFWWRARFENAPRCGGRSCRLLWQLCYVPEHRKNVYHGVAWLLWTCAIRTWLSVPTIGDWYCFDV